MDEDDVVVDSWRYTRPYLHVTESIAKGRWVGSPLFTMLCKEYTFFEAAYHTRCISNGLLRVNSRRSHPEYRIQHSDKLSYLCHRHENPIRSTQLVVHESQHDADILIVDKPASWPMHPAGAYRKATLAYILQREFGVRPHLLYRLDRLVSGLLLVARSSESATRFKALLAQESTVKLYVARVSGRLEPQAHTQNNPGDVPGVVRIEHRIRLVDGGARRGEFEAGPHVTEADGKSAVTEVLPIAYDPESDTTLCLCRPVTGRTHQLRVHLQSVGHPIGNDPCYGGLQKFMRNDGTSVVPTRWPVESRILNGEFKSDRALPSCDDGAEGAEGAVAMFSEEDFASAVELCPFCAESRRLGSVTGGESSDSSLDPSAGFQSSIWLHCLCYTMQGFQFRVDPPVWLHEVPSSSLHTYVSVDERRADIAHTSGSVLQPRALGRRISPTAATAATGDAAGHSHFTAPATARAAVVADVDRDSTSTAYAAASVVPVPECDTNVADTELRELVDVSSAWWLANLLQQRALGDELGAAERGFENFSDAPTGSHISSAFAF